MSEGGRHSEPTVGRYIFIASDEYTAGLETGGRESTYTLGMSAEVDATWGRF